MLTKSQDGTYLFNQLRYNSFMGHGHTVEQYLEDEEQLKKSFPSFSNEKIHDAPLGDISNDINTERTIAKNSILEEKLRLADEILRDNIFELKKIKDERDSLKQENLKLKK